MSNENKSKNTQSEAEGLAAIAKAIREHASMSRPESDPEFQKRENKHHRLQFCGLIVATVYAVVTFFLLLTTREAVNLTREQVHTGQRAYLIVDHVKLDYPPTIGKEVRAALEIRNAGQTPALKLASFVITDILASEPGSITGTPLPSVDIGAGQVQPMFVRRITPLEPQEVSDITQEIYSLNGSTLTLSNSRRLYVYGIIKYADVFGGQD
jgi:hypothetical protein